jgi:hypothetical protein
MDQARATWMVVYRDGTLLYESDTSSPYFHQRPDGTGEVPKRAIDWTRVESFVFESPTLVRGVSSGGTGWRRERRCT